LSANGQKPEPKDKPPESLSSRILRHPVLMLSGASVVGLVLSLIQFAVALAILTPQDFAVIGVLMASGAFVANFVDVRLVDLTTKLYNDARPAGPEAQADVLRAGALIQAAIALVVLALGLVFTGFASRWLLTQPVTWAMILSASAVPSAMLLSSMLSAYLRLLGAFNAFSAYRLVSQALQALIITGLLLVFRSPAAYLAGMGISALMILALAWFWLLPAMRRELAVGFADAPGSRSALRQHIGQTTFFAAGSALSFSKMMSRTGDVLMVAALSNDLTTGLYRIARQAADAVYALADSVNQFYGPTIVAAVSRGDAASYRHLRGRVVLLALLATAGSLILALLVLPWIGERYAPQYLGAVPPFTMFALALIFLIGIHSWLWPAMVAQGTVGWFGIANLAGAAAQFLAMLGLAQTGHFTATSAAACFLLLLVVAYTPFLFVRALRRW
jgi:O-antigen/teichoic acid export membrane protein